MADTVPPETRSRMMAGIRATGTRPEMILRRGLHRAGFRFRLHVLTLPGKPDLVFPRYRAALFANGCFWHGHDCHLFRLPDTRREFWSAKIVRNRKRDAEVREQLQTSGWRVLTIWECAIRTRGAPELAEVIASAAAWLRSGSARHELRGVHSGGR